MRGVSHTTNKFFNYPEVIPDTNYLKLEQSIQIKGLSPTTLQVIAASPSIAATYTSDQHAI